MPGTWVKRHASFTAGVRGLGWFALHFAGFTVGSQVLDWREAGREAFLTYLVHLGCTQCAALLGGGVSEVFFGISSHVFGCADVDVLLPSLHWIYETSRKHLHGALPGILIDGGANVGRASSRWIAAFGDVFGRRVGTNATHTPCVICAGADAAGSGVASGSSGSPPTVFVVAVEPSAANFALLEKYADESGWRHEGFLGIQAALGDKPGEAMLAFNEDFAIDEVATLLFQATDARPRQPVRVLTLDDVVRAAADFVGNAFTLPDEVFLLKLDIEGMEPAVLRSITSSKISVKFVVFEYSSAVWQEPLVEVVSDLQEGGYFCFLVTPERLFPVSPPFWDPVYDLPVWNNLLCGREDDEDLADLVRLHVGAIGLWPLLPNTYLEGFAGGHEEELPFPSARKLCTDLGAECSGITCVCPSRDGNCGRPPGLPVERCTARSGFGGAKRSPSGEVTFLRDPDASELFLLRRRDG